MNPRRQIFGPVARPIGDTDNFRLLSSTLALNLLLYDKFVIHSALLREIPLIVDQFGLEDTLAMLNSGAIEIHSEATQIMNMGSTEEAVRTGKLYELDFKVVVDHDHREAIARSSENIKRQLKLPINDFIRLKAAVVTHLDTGIRDDKFDRPEFKAARGLTQALEANTSTLKYAVAQQLIARGIAAPPSDAYTLVMHRRDGDRFFAETDLAEIAKCDAATAHDVIQQGALSLGGLRSLLEYMSHYEAIGTISTDDIALMSDDLRLFADRLDDEQTRQQFSRVVEIKGFPSLGILARENQLRLDRILELRESKEIQEFREWLPTIADVSEAELTERINSFSNHVASFLRSNPGKGLRWLVTKGIGLGFDDVAASVGVSTTASLANTFLVERLFPVSGPISFINGKLGSVFEMNTGATRAGLTLLNLEGENE